MIQSLKGIKDLLDEDGLLYEEFINTASKIAKHYDYTHILSPHLEKLELFKRSVGENSEVAAKQMYEFIDKGGHEIALRPEGTAGVVRAYIQSNFDKNQGKKRWYYHGSMFRYERPQLGRLREFHQFGVECFGEKSPYEDASIIFLLADILKAYDIKATLHLNSLGCKLCRSSYTKDFLDFLSEKEGFCKDCKKRLLTNPIRMLDCKNKNCQSLLLKAPSLQTRLCPSCEKHFLKVQSLLKPLPFILDNALVRGLDYYSKTAFEFISDEIGAKSAIAGGGRYDDLISFLGGKEGFGLGFGLGIERLMHIIKSKNIKKSKNSIYLCSLDELYLDRLFLIACELRKEFDLFFSLEIKKLAKHLSMASNMNKKIFLCMGEDEAKNDELFYKDLQSKEDKKIKISKLKELL